MGERRVAPHPSTRGKMPLPPHFPFDSKLVAQDADWLTTKLKRNPFGAQVNYQPQDDSSEPFF